jgi:molybdate transport system substrate-binding protein
MAHKSRLIGGIAVALFSAALIIHPGVSAEDRSSNSAVVVFAAASLKNAMDGVSAAWQKESGQSVKVSYAASSALAKQIEQDAPAQIFISADLDWMDYVAGKGLIKPESRFNFLGNKLVLIAPKESAVTLDLKPGADLAGALGNDRLATGSVDSVPAGKYGKAALEKLGIWASVADKLAQAESVRAALLLVSRGEAPLGIVYRTDAAADPGVKIVASFPADSHPPIVYPIALTRKAAAEAAAFLGYIRSAKAEPFFEAQGFTVLKSDAEKRP